MNVELKFKPGVRTSLNSSNNIRDSFSGKKTEGGVNQTRNSTAASAKENLSTMTRASGNWSSKTGSILNNNETPARTMNSRSATTSSTAASSTTSPKQGTIRDTNYVPGTRTVKYTQPKYDTYQDFGYTRSENMTGYSGRGLQRMLNSAYNTDSTNAYAYLNAQPTQTTTASDVVAAGTNIMDLVKTGKELFDVIFSKDSKSSIEGGGGTPSETSATNVKNMKAANDSATLDSAINNSKQDLETTKSSVADMEANLAKAQADQPKLETDLKTAQDNYNNLDTQVKNQTEILNQNTKALTTAQTSYESAKGAYEKAPDEPADVKAQLKEAMDTAKSKMDAIQQKIDEANAQLEQLNPQLTEAKGKLDDAQEAVNTNKKTIEETPAQIQNAKSTIASYEAEIPKQEERLTKMIKKETEKLAELNEDSTELQQEVTELKGEGKTEKAEKKEKKLNEVNTERDTLQEQADIRSLDDVQYSGGHEFKKGLDSHGMPIFVIDGKKVTEEEYNQQLGPQEQEPKTE